MIVLSEFRKSSYSAAQNNCVEVAVDGGRFAIRDSKNPEGPVLTWPRATLVRFVAVVEGSRPAR